jgi:hypothetical protein
VCNVFLVCEPPAGWRDVMGSDRRTRIDWAHCVKDLLDVHYPDAERVVLVQDDLNTHTPASLYEAFAPAEARRLADRLELHYTPKHGSWLSMAEIELSVLSQQCLDRRLADQATLEREVAAREAAGNATGRWVDWRSTTEDARIKLEHLYRNSGRTAYEPEVLLVTLARWSCRWSTRKNLCQNASGTQAPSAPAISRPTAMSTHTDAQSMTR